MANEPQGGTTVAAERSEHDEQVLPWICTKECLLEERNAAGKDHVPHHNETAPVGGLIIPNLLLALAPASIGCCAEVW